MIQKSLTLKQKTFWPFRSLPILVDFYLNFSILWAVTFKTTRIFFVEGRRKARPLPSHFFLFLNSFCFFEVPSSNLIIALSSGERRIGQVWVCWKAVFMLYLFNVLDFWISSSKRLRFPKCIVPNGTKLAGAVQNELKVSFEASLKQRCSGQVELTFDYPF